MRSLRPHRTAAVYRATLMGAGAADHGLGITNHGLFLSNDAVRNVIRRARSTKRG